MTIKRNDRDEKVFAHTSLPGFKDIHKWVWLVKTFKYVLIKYSIVLYE